MVKTTSIKFYIPDDETIPTELRLYVGDVYVTYERTNGGYDFNVLIDDEVKAIEVVKQIVRRMEHQSYDHGAEWRTESLDIVPQEGRYKVGTLVRWKYRIRDSY